MFLAKGKCVQLSLTHQASACAGACAHRRRAGDGEVVDEFGGHLDERGLGPGQEPVDGAAGDEARELLCAAAKLGAHGAEAQHDVQPVAHAAQKERVQRVRGVRRACKRITASLLHLNPDM